MTSPINLRGFLDLLMCEPGIRKSENTFECKYLLNLDGLNFKFGPLVSRNIIQNVFLNETTQHFPQAQIMCLSAPAFKEAELTILNQDPIDLTYVNKLTIHHFSHPPEEIILRTQAFPIPNSAFLQSTTILHPSDKIYTALLVYMDLPPDPPAPFVPPAPFAPPIPFAPLIPFIPQPMITCLNALNLINSYLFIEAAEKTEQAQKPSSSSSSNREDLPSLLENTSSLPTPTQKKKSDTTKNLVSEAAKTAKYSSGKLSQLIEAAESLEQSSIESSSSSSSKANPPDNQLTQAIKTAKYSSDKLPTQSNSSSSSSHPNQKFILEESAEDPDTLTGKRSAEKITESRKKINSSIDPSLKILEEFKMLAPEGSLWLNETAIKSARSLDELSAKDIEKLYEINQEIITDGIPSYLSLLKVNPTVNYGVFLKPDSETIKKGTLIGIYSGKYVLIGNTQNSFDNTYLFSLLEDSFKLDETTIKHSTYEEQRSTSDEFDLCIDGKTCGNFTRFINHTIERQANIYPALVKLPDGRPAVVFFAKKNILPGEQLLYNYGRNYWKTCGVSPSTMKPNSYILNRDGLLESPEPSEETESSSAPPATTELEQVVMSKIAILSNSLLKKCEKWQKQLEIDNALKDIQISNGRNPVISFSQSAKVVKQKDFIATLTGTFNGLKNNNGILITETSRSQIYFNPSKENYGLEQLLKTSNPNGNVELKFYHNLEDNTIQAVLVATKKILPGDTLCLVPFIEMS